MGVGHAETGAQRKRQREREREKERETARTRNGTITRTRKRGNKREIEGENERGTESAGFVVTVCARVHTTPRCSYACMSVCMVVLPLAAETLISSLNRCLVNTPDSKQLLLAVSGAMFQLRENVPKAIAPPKALEGFFLPLTLLNISRLPHDSWKAVC